MSHVMPSGDADMNQIDFFKRFNFHSDVQACGFIDGTLWRGNLDYIKDGRLWKYQQREREEPGLANE